MPDWQTRLLRRAATIACVLSLLGRPARLAAQHEGHAASRDGIDATRLGTVSFPTSGAAAAQPAFLRGLALMHSFEYEEAAAAFREAQRLDPGFAMAYWGEAMTYNHGIWEQQDSSAARAVLARLGATPAARAAKAPTAREQDYLRTLDVLYAATGTKQARDSAYANAMRRLAERHPDDADAQLFHALALLSLFPRTDDTYGRAGAIAERVMREHPRHPGALHYVIHAYDDPAHARRALPAARAYGAVAPGAPHARHMTSHIFIALGMWDDVVAANESAVAASMRGAAPPRPPCGHYAIWLQYAYMQQGRRGDARRMMEACRAGVRSRSAVAGFAQMRLRYLLDVDGAERNGSDASAVRALAAIPAGALSPSDSTIVLGTLDFGTAFGALRRGDTVGVPAFIERYAEASRAAERDLGASALEETAGTRAIAEQELRALLLLRRGRADDALATLRRAVAQEDALPFAFGPPPVDEPSRELLGDVLLELGHAAEARREFERALARTPERSSTLLGLARASRAAGDSAAATAAFRRLLTNWHRADATLAVMREARQGHHRARTVR